MNKIETKILNCFAVKEAEKNMVFAARLTQRGHIIHSMNDLMDLYNQSFTDETLTNLGELPHPAIQKFTVITLAVVGASRRFLSQITRHQNEVKFMSASLQYSNYSGEANFAIPYEIISASPEIHAIISNVSNKVQTIHKETRVGQLVITPIIIADFVFDLGKERGTDAFGSSGE